MPIILFLMNLICSAVNVFFYATSGNQLSLASAVFCGGIALLMLALMSD